MGLMYGALFVADDAQCKVRFLEDHAFVIILLHPDDAAGECLLVDSIRDCTDVAKHLTYNDALVEVPIDTLLSCDGVHELLTATRWFQQHDDGAAVTPVFECVSVFDGSLRLYRILCVAFVHDGTYRLASVDPRTAADRDRLLFMNTPFMHASRNRWSFADWFPD